MGNLFSLNKNNKYGSSRRIYIHPQFDKVEYLNKYLSGNSSKHFTKQISKHLTKQISEHLTKHLTKQTLTQTMSDPTAIGKFDQKPNTPFEDKRKDIPAPKIISQDVRISAIELNKLKNDINILRQLLRIEIDQKNALIELVKKQQLDMLNNIKYYQVLNTELQNKIKSMKSDLTKSNLTKSNKQIKDLTEQLEIVQTKLQIKLNEVRNETYINMLNLKQLEILRNKERILVLEDKKLSYIIQKIYIENSIQDKTILCQDKNGKLYYVSDPKCPPDMTDAVQNTIVQTKSDQTKSDQTKSDQTKRVETFNILSKTNNQIILLLIVIILAYLFLKK
jgi:hypothetical protein